MNKELRQKIYNKYKGHCAYCGEKIEYKSMQVDHIIPQCNYTWYIKNNIHIPEFLNHLTIDDVDHADNLNPACRICNKWKSAHHLELFRSEIEAQVDRLNKYSSNYRIAKKYGLIVEDQINIVFYFEKFNKVKFYSPHEAEPILDKQTLNKIYDKYAGNDIIDYSKEMCEKMIKLGEKDRWVFDEGL